MLWRGLFQEALQVLATQPLASGNSETSVRRLTSEGVAFAHLQRFSEANQALAHAEDLCSSTSTPACGDISRARGVLAVQQGEYELAKRWFLRNLSYAQSRRDRSMESTDFLNLGSVALLIEHYDEALDWSWSAYRAGVALGDENQIQGALGNLGAAYTNVGDSERASKMFLQAEERAASLGNFRDQLNWQTDLGYVYMDAGDFSRARQSYSDALELARAIDSKEDVTYATMSLALVALASANAPDAEKYANQAFSMAGRSGSRPDLVSSLALQMQTAALRGDTLRAEQLLRAVEASPEAEASMRWASEDAMARLYESQGNASGAAREYAVALATFEAARAGVQQASSQLPFAANATRIYDDSIHFLVSQGKIEQALQQADRSRAQTLAQGLDGAIGKKSEIPSISSQAVAKKAGSTLLFYWLGEKQSYLWAVTPENTSLFTLPPGAEIETRAHRYDKALQGAGDPLEDGNPNGQALYRSLVAPAAELLKNGRPVMILADGPLSELNFETLIVPGTSTAKSHYWIDDATVMAAPSMAMLATAKPARSDGHRLLLLGDADTPSAEYPQLRWAGLEMTKIESHFDAGNAVVFAHGRATPAAYLNGDPARFGYIHFVSHGFASRTDPLDSAIILSRPDAPGGGVEDSFKLYARDVMQHPIDARLVTISACNGSGARSYAGEGLVGLSWAFLRAGAHNAIGALWEASDESTPRLMDALYAGLQQGDSPAAALRKAKLTLLHSGGRFGSPFYWAPFQLYTRM